MFRSALTRLLSRWKSYRHRFVPWIALNLSKDEKSLRQVSERRRDKVTPDEEVSGALLRLFGVLLHGARQRGPGAPLHASAGVHDAMFQTLGFCVDRGPSSVPLAGTGVFVTRGAVHRGAVVAMYPGTVYQPHEPIFFQSIRNPFVFRCIDGVLIDGSDRGVSKAVFRSCSGRDRLGSLLTSDTSWLTSAPLNPLSVGQYVNNCSGGRPANVCYQEFDVPDGFPVELRRYLPNANFSPETSGPLRCVVLVSLRDIPAGEELFSNYYTIVH